MSLNTEQLTAALMQDFAGRKPLRTGSLIVSLFGDSIAPHGGVVWIGSLIRALAPLGISARLVRTAVFRLVQDGILSSKQQGRRSFYTLTADGRSQFEEATARIYSQPVTPWDGSWSVVLLSGVPTRQRAVLRQDLIWLGFGSFGVDILAHPRPDKALTQLHLQRQGVADQAVLLDAQITTQADDPSLQRLVTQAWDLSTLEQSYSDYLSKFSGLQEALEANATVNEADAFYIRTFMIHEYRKIVLRDPALPAELLPKTWQGHTAYQLSRGLYRHIAAPSERYIVSHFENQQGLLTGADASFVQRFA